MTRVGVLIAGAIGAMGAMVATGTAEAKGARTRARLEPAEVASAGDGLGASEPAVTAPAAPAVREAVLQRVAAAADGIVSVATAERLAEVSRVALRSALSTLALSRRRAELGVATRLDLLRGEQDLSEARAQVVAADEGLVRAREAF